MKFEKSFTFHMVETWTVKYWFQGPRFPKTSISKRKLHFASFLHLISFAKRWWVNIYWFWVKFGFNLKDCNSIRLPQMPPSVNANFLHKHKHTQSHGFIRSLWRKRFKDFPFWNLWLITTAHSFNDIELHDPVVLLILSINYNLNCKRDRITNNFLHSYDDLTFNIHLMHHSNEC